LVPAWDFVADGRLASRVAAMRAVEGGFAVARAAQEGLVAVSDDRGRILAEAATSDKREALLVVDVSTGPGGTLYARAGDWFAWTVTAIAAAILVALGADAIQGGRAECFASGASNPGNANPR
jgi:apolipoprotein N-acyltransferase